MLRDVIEWTHGLYHVDVERQDDGSVDVRAYAAPGAPRLVTQPVKARIAELAAAARPPTFRYHLNEPARTRLLARAVDVPGFGWRPVAAEPLDVAPVEIERRRCSRQPSMSNGLVDHRGRHRVRDVLDHER